MRRVILPGHENRQGENNPRLSKWQRRFWADRRTFEYWRSFYGTTGAAGTCTNGTVFSINPNTKAEKVIHAFNGGSDGCSPETGLVEIAGTLYGTCAVGGPADAGTVFSIDLTSGAEKTIYSFQGGQDGGGPSSRLIVFDGELYGTTNTGGDKGDGVIYSIDVATGAERILHSFGYGVDGSGPTGSLLKVGAKLYGTTSGGGDNSAGTIFEFKPATGTESVIYSFSSGPSDGAVPWGGLVDVHGTFYGFTFGGGIFAKDCPTRGCGTVFSFDPASKTEKVLHEFQGGSDGTELFGSRLTNVAGTLYGITQSGGTSGNGTVFAVTP